ncbi:hypothetical protein NG99_20035 [Erwinia typographi]|uniref:Phage-related lipoprotein n=2 Tax=Erwinia typographi TaxID=371042 RepID=A0A0A3YUE5_9GAMM|nr:hypothetical protein NG99_20035 [Erwinia typographi]
MTLLMVAVMVLSGCSSYKKVKVEQEPTLHSHYFLTEPPLYVGDKIKYRLKDGRKGELAIEKITAQEIVGKNATLPLSQIAMLEKKDISTVKTGAAIGGGAIAIGVILTVALATGLASAFI